MSKERMTAEKLKEKLSSYYIECSTLKVPAVGTRLFYPIFESVIDNKPHLKEGDFIEAIGSDFVVMMLGVGKFRDKANKFFMLSD